MISVAVDMLPLPGGMGISEKLFSMLFTGIFGQVKVLAGLILSRGLSYYTELLISAVMTVAAQLFLGNEKEHREKISEKLKTIQEKGKGYERKRGTHDKFYWLLQLHGDSDVYQSVLFHCGDVVYCERVV